MKLSTRPSDKEIIEIFEHFDFKENLQRLTTANCVFPSEKTKH